MKRQSAIYEGRVRHRRFSPKEHEFTYSIQLLLLDLRELKEVFQGSWIYSVDRRTPVAFRRGDHLGDPEVSLDESVRNLVEERTGCRPSGPIRLLTQLAHFGYCFNPVSFYYVYDAGGGTRVETIVAEVNNTPWRERHCYVLNCREGDADSQCQTTSRHLLTKEFHVSPFMPMEIEYDWRLTSPAARLVVHMENWDGNRNSGEIIFDATMTLSRREITPSTLRRAFLRFPFQSLRVIASIHLQALRLWSKGCPFHSHPKKITPTTTL